MIPYAMNGERNTLTSDGRLRSRLCRGGFALLAALCLGFLPTKANAACGSLSGAIPQSSLKLPLVAQAELGFADQTDETDPAIVGLWHVIYTTGSGADSATFNDTFDMWHSDGTEFESAFLPPLGGNVCVGVWKQVEIRSFKLHHVGWLFNPANPSGTATNYFTLDEAITVAPNRGSYSGSFTFKVWNLDGSFTGTEVTGTIAATRITVE